RGPSVRCKCAACRPWRRSLGRRMTDLERALEDCLTRLIEDPLQGMRDAVPLEMCLARYPEHAGELRRLLVTASQLERGRGVSAPPDFKARTRARLVAHIATHPR